MTNGSRRNERLRAFGSRLHRKAVSMRADLRVLWPASTSRVLLVPWLLTSGRGPLIERHVQHFNLDGLRFSVRSTDLLGVREILVEGEYDFVLPFLATERPVVLDLGSNIGVFALHCLRHRPRARVHSYEPGAGTFEVLAANAAANSSLDWTPIHAAVVDVDGTVPFMVSRYSTGSRVSASGREQVRAVGMATVLKRLRQDDSDDEGVVDVMKVDIEGSEEAFLVGAEDLLARVRTVVIEIHPDLCDAANVTTLLERRYRHVQQILGRQSSKPLLLATDQEVSADSLPTDLRPTAT